jgi:hypothetical protein
VKGILSKTTNNYGSWLITSANVPPRSIQKSQALAGLSLAERRFEFTFG